MIQVHEKDRDAIRTAYLARHPDAFWVKISLTYDLCRHLISLDYSVHLN